jgi:hypothetical protein
MQRFLAVLLAGLWVNVSEFFRNELLFKHYWTEHYQSLGMTFPSAPVNGMVWMLWGFLFAWAIYLISRKFDFKQTVQIGWLMGFVLMWVVVGNLGMLPPGILVYAVPLSLLEVAVAAVICRKLAPVA